MIHHAIAFIIVKRSSMLPEVSIALEEVFIRVIVIPAHLIALKIGIKK
jgi:hypothetical protein